MLLFLPLATVASAVLDSDSKLVREGYFDLRWNQLEKPSEWEIQQSLTKDFSEIAQTFDIASGSGSISLSGYDDGKYFFRLWNRVNHFKSTPVEIHVEHYPLSMAFIWFGLGAFLFATLLFILYIASQRSFSSVSLSSNVNQRASISAETVNTEVKNSEIENYNSEKIDAKNIDAKNIDTDIPSFTHQKYSAE